MANQVTKLIFRRGADATGRTITLNQGEPGYTTDTKRLYVGDGTTTLGIPIGIKNWNIKNFNTANFTTTFSGSEIGDIVYDDYSNHVFFLTAWPGTIRANWAKIDFTVDVDDTTIEVNTASALQLKNYGIQSIHLNSNIVGQGLLGAAGAPLRVDVDNLSIDINNNKLRVIPGAISIDYLGTITPFSILGNTKAFNSTIEAIPVGNGQVIGRLGGALQAINFADIVANGGGVAQVTASNGLSAMIDTSVFPNNLKVGLNANVITASTGSITLNAPTTINGLSQVNGTLRVTGDIIAYYSSDENLKKDIEYITGSLDKLAQMRGVEFAWKENNQRELGVIAQEVEKVAPLVVATRPDNTKAVRYEKLIPLLINGINELSKEVTNLKQQIVDLKK